MFVALFQFFAFLPEFWDTFNLWIALGYISARVSYNVFLSLYR